MSLREGARALAMLPPEERAKWIAGMSPLQILIFDAQFECWSHESQHEPEGEGWRTWLMMAGRGFGKTRAGAEWISRLAAIGRPVRIALVGATIDEARKVMVEGKSGLLAVGRRLGRIPKWEPSLGRLTWPNGSVAELFSGENPDGLRGPQHDFAWCDELAKWARPEETWHNLQLGLRSGARPRALVTTTPRPLKLLKQIEGETWTVVTRGRTTDNISLPRAYLDVMVATYAGTRLGRQELDGILIEDVEGALWTREGIENGRAAMPAADDLVRVVIGLDPPASAHGDECGIVVCGLGPDGIAYVLDDRSAGGLSPEGWGRAVALAAETWEADLVVAETNQGGEMVERVLLGVDAALPVLPVQARLGKGKRAEPVSTWFARGRAKLAGRFPALEDQLCAMTHGGGYEATGSPDRADAMVWAMTELLDAPARVPRIIVL